MDDKQILELYHSGEKRQAFNIIIRKYGERLYLHIRQMTNCHEDANDCVQDTFVRAWQAMDTFRGDSNIYTWLYRIGTNETINFLRKQKIKSVFHPIDVAAHLADDPSFNGDKAQVAFQEALAKLPPRQKAVFTMRYYDEMPYEQISEILETSVSSLKASYHFACTKMKKWILNYLDD